MSLAQKTIVLVMGYMWICFFPLTILAQNDDHASINFASLNYMVYANSDDAVYQTIEVTPATLANAPGGVTTADALNYTLKEVYIVAELSLNYLQLDIKPPYPGAPWIPIIDQFGQNRIIESCYARMETSFYSSHYGGGNPKPNEYSAIFQIAHNGGYPWNDGFYCAAGDYSVVNGQDLVGTWTVRIRNCSKLSNGTCFKADECLPYVKQVKLVFGKAPEANYPTGGDNCSSATVLGMPGLYGGNTGLATANNNIDPISSTAGSNCEWNPTNDHTLWYQFEAIATTMNFNLNAIDCTGGTAGLQLQVVTAENGVTDPCNAYQGTPINWEFNPVEGGCPFDVYGAIGYFYGRTDNSSYSLSNLQVGKTYYIVLDSNPGVACKYVLEVVDGVGSTTVDFNCEDFRINDIIITNPTCGSTGGSMTVMITGAVGSTTIDIGNGIAPVVTDESYYMFNNLPPGNYNVSVTCNGDCTYTSLANPHTIWDANAFNFDFTTTNETALGAANGAVDLCITGGFAPYNVTISPNNGNTYVIPSTTCSSNYIISGLAAGSYNLNIIDNAGCSSESTFTIATGLECNIEISDVQPNNPTCFGEAGGSMLIIVEGSNGDSFQYSMDGGLTFSGWVNNNMHIFSNLLAGTYNVIVRDNAGCEVAYNMPIVLSAPNPLFATTNVTQPAPLSGIQGAIEVCGVGGVGPYQLYTIPSTSTANTSVNGDCVTVNNLAAGSYDVYLYDANGCVFLTEDVEIIQAATNCEDMETNIQVVTVYNPFGATSSYYNSINLFVENGAAPYDYEWDVRGYLRRSFINVEPPIINAIYDDEAVWSVTITDANGCYNVISSVSVEPLLGIFEIRDYEVSPAIGGTNGTIDIWVEGGEMFPDNRYKYEWAGPAGFDGGSLPVLASNHYQLTNLTPGWYSVTVTDATLPLPRFQMGWYWISNIGGGGKTETEIATRLNCYPNPFVDAATVEFTSSDDTQLSVGVYGLNGQLITTLYDGDVKANTTINTTFNAEELNSGIYLVRLTTASGATTYQKLVLTK